VGFKEYPNSTHREEVFKIAPSPSTFEAEETFQPPSYFHQDEVARDYTEFFADLDFSPLPAPVGRQACLLPDEKAEAVGVTPTALTSKRCWSKLERSTPIVQIYVRFWSNIRPWSCCWDFDPRYVSNLPLGLMFPKRSRPLDIYGGNSRQFPI
jgi:hypothetical protein